jgi:hypothetical protein
MMDNKIYVTNQFSSKDVKVSNLNISLYSLIKKLEHDEIDLNPNFRKDVKLWSRKKMSRFIESILLRLPLPILYFDVTNPDKWIVVDGQQRLYTLKNFILDEKSFKLKDLEFLKNLNDKTYNDLNRSLKRIIDETQIITYQIEAQTPKEVRDAIYNRVNEGVIK